MEYSDNNILCVTWKDLTEGDDKSENPKEWPILSACALNKYLTRHPNVKERSGGGADRHALIAYDRLRDDLKELIKAKYCDGKSPYEVVKVNRFGNSITDDTEARQYYRAYVLTDGRHLPEENIEEYCANAAVLNALHIVITDRRAMRKALGGSTSKMWDKMAEVISSLERDPKKGGWCHTLPANVRRLKDKYKEYINEGYEVLIHAGFCNRNTEKINDLAKIWLLAKWANQVEKIANEKQLLNDYNIEAAKKGWSAIKSVGSIHNFLFREDIKEMWWGHRYGELKAKEKFAYQHSTKLPTMRDSLWYSDGTKLNYFYQDENGKVSTIQVYEVLDVYSEVLIGYHISKTEDFEAQFRAYKMALQFSGCKPYQITYDNQGGHKKLENSDFLTKMAHLNIKTKPYNGKSKTIENVFYRFQSEFLKRDWFFTGQNITTKKLESKANLEFILANKANLPTLVEVKEKYLQRRNEWNNAPHPKSGKTRLETYRESANVETVKVDLLDMVDLFWITRPTPITCTAYGLEFTEKKEDYTYMVLNADRKPDIDWLRKNIDKKFIVKYDPDDTSLIYLYEKDATGLRFVTEAETKIEVHRGKQEQEEWEAQFLAEIEAMNTEARIQTRDKMDAILEQHGLLPEQNGLFSPRIKGVEKVKKKGGEIGKVQKAVSNVVAGGEDDEEINVYNLY